MEYWSIVFSSILAVRSFDERRNQSQEEELALRSNRCLNREMSGGWAAANASLQTRPIGERYGGEKVVSRCDFVREIRYHTSMRQKNEAGTEASHAGAHSLTATTISVELDVTDL